MIYPPMKAFTLSLLLLTAAFAFAEKLEEPSDIFLRAFSFFQKAEKLEATDSLPEATQTYKQADALLKELQEKHPTWNKQIVEYRKKRIASALERIGTKPGTPVAPPPPQVPPPTPRSPDFDPLPEQLPDTKGWHRFEFNGQPFYFVPLLILPDQARL